MQKDKMRQHIAEKRAGLAELEAIKLQNSYAAEMIENLKADIKKHIADECYELECEHNPLPVVENYNEPEFVEVEPLFLMSEKGERK